MAQHTGFSTPSYPLQETGVAFVPGLVFVRLRVPSLPAQCSVGNKSNTSLAKAGALGGEGWTDRARRAIVHCMVDPEAKNLKARPDSRAHGL